MKKLLLCIAMMPALLFNGIANPTPKATPAKADSSTPATSTGDIGELDVFAEGTGTSVNTLSPQQSCSFVGFTWNNETKNYQKEIEVNIDSPLSLANVIASVKALDPKTNKNVAVELVSNEQKYPENLKVGKYIMTFSAEANSYQATAQLTINVIDISKPSIVGPSEIKSGYTNPKTISQILSMYYVKDNVDNDIQISVENDRYTANKNSIGNYKMTLVASDASKNTIKRDITINVIDDVAPVLTAPAKIYKNTSTILTVSDIEYFVSAYDDIDGDIAATIREDQFTGNGNKEGTYQVTFQAKDKVGNSVNKTVEIVVTADITGNGFLVDDSTLVTFNDTLLKNSDIVSFLTAADILTSGQNYVSITADTYSAAYEKTGVYSYEMKARSNSGVEKIVALDIQVVEAEEGTLVKEKTFWQLFCDFFVRLWNWLCGKGWTL